MASDYDSTVALMAATIATSSLVGEQNPIQEAVRMARAIVAEVKRTEPVAVAVNDTQRGR